MVPFTAGQRMTRLLILEASHLRWSYFDEETAAFVRNLEDFGPRKTVDPQFIFIDHETTGTHPQRDVHAIQILTDSFSLAF